jgi:hypothetical protein
MCCHYHTKDYVVRRIAEAKTKTEIMRASSDTSQGDIRGADRLTQNTMEAS